MSRCRFGSVCSGHTENGQSGDRCRNRKDRGTTVVKVLWNVTSHLESVSLSRLLLLFLGHGKFAVDDGQGILVVTCSDDVPVVGFIEGLSVGGNVGAVNGESG